MKIEEIGEKMSICIIMRRRAPEIWADEITYRSFPIVDELNGPSALVTDPDEDDAGCVARGQFLIRLVPSH